MEHPDKNETARRALCLGALVMRGKFESIAASGSPRMITVHEELATQLNIWLADEGLIASQSTQEKPLVSKALNSWSRQENIDAASRANSLGVHPLGTLPVRGATSVGRAVHPPGDNQAT